MKHLVIWLDTLLKCLEDKDETGDNAAILEKCGRTCARSYIDTSNDIHRIRERYQNSRDIDEMLSALNQKHIGGGQLKKVDDTILGVYEKCYCPIREQGYVSSAFFCECTCGWAKEVFETVFGKPVEVELTKAIGRGDNICEFIVHLEPGRIGDVSTYAS